MSKPTDGPAGPDKQQQTPPKSGGGGLIVNIITTILICSIFLGVNYVMVNDASKRQLAANTENTEDEGDIEEVTKGYIVDLGEFTMNLADASPKTYLRAAVVIEVTVNDTDVLSAGGGEGHGHGGGTPQPTIEDDLARVKPAIRDAIITTLSSKTSDELSTTTGKELAKEQIAEQVNAIFAGEREVLRISFGQFIMQPGR